MNKNVVLAGLIFLLSVSVKAVTCEDWTASSQAATLARGNFNFIAYNTPQKAEIRKNISILCSMLFPGSQDLSISRVCIQGSITESLPYLTQLAATERGMHGTLGVSGFGIKSASEKGVVFSAATFKKTGYVTPTVPCEGCRPTPEEPANEPNCEFLGTCKSRQQEEAALPPREFLLPQCSNIIFQ